jgi:hypothetical protein
MDERGAGETDARDHHRPARAGQGRRESEARERRGRDREVDGEGRRRAGDGKPADRA